MFTIYNCYQDETLLGEKFSSFEDACEAAMEESKNPIASGTVKVLDDNGVEVACYCNGQTVRGPHYRSQEVLETRIRMLEKRLAKLEGKFR